MKNKDAFLQAQSLIPGGVDSPVRAFQNVGGEPFFVKKGDGAYIEDIENKRYLDFVLSWGPLIFGHCDTDIQEAVLKAAKNGLSFGAPCLGESELASLILSDFDFLNKIRFVNSGTEATMSAIRLARGFTGRDGLIKFEGCYHGHSDSLLVKAGSGAATFGNSSSAGVPQDFAKHTYVAIYNDIKSVEEIFSNNKDKIACVIVEAIAGNMGFVPADETFMQDLRKICDKFGAVLIVDEVMSGYRSSKKGSFGYYDIKADIVTFGKVIGGGLPTAAFAGRKDIMECVSPLGDVYQAGTLSGNPLSMAAGIAAISKIHQDETLYDRLSELTSTFTKGLKSLAKTYQIPFVADYRGSMFGYFFTEKNVKNYTDALTSDLNLFAKFHQNMLKNGVFLAPSQFETGFVCAKTTKKDIEFALDKAEISMKNL